MSQARVDEAVEPQESPGGDPVRAHTNPERLEEIDEGTAR